jgi:putative ABC transport system substrate-binding protein
MTRRRELLGLLTLTAANASLGQTTRSATGQRRLAVLVVTPRDKDAVDDEQDVRSALAKFGWIVDRNLTIEWHYANNDPGRLPALAAAIVRSAPDAILTFLTPPTRALQLATQTIPIVTMVRDPLEHGIARDYARPGGNVTGLSNGWVELQRKRIELLRSAAPAPTRLVIATHAGNAIVATDLTRPALDAAREFGFVPEVALLQTAADLPAVLRSDRASAMIIYGFGAPSSPIKAVEVIAVSLAKRVPTMVDDDASVAIGGLMSYQLLWDNAAQRLADLLDKVLRGANPAEIPFELPTHSKLAINLKTAKTLGLALPASLLARVDEVFQ